MLCEHAARRLSTCARIGSAEGCPMTIPYGKIKNFHLDQGRILGEKYVIEELLGEGWASASS